MGTREVAAVMEPALCFECHPGVYFWFGSANGVPVSAYVTNPDIALRVEPLCTDEVFGVRLVDQNGVVYASTITHRCAGNADVWG